MPNYLLGLLIPLVYNFLQKAAQGLWEGVWEEILKAVDYAESKWEESGRGKDKKKWVQDTVMAFIDARTKLGWIQRLVVNMFVSKAIDAVISTFNEEMGQDWKSKVTELKESLADKIPFIN